jgi:hypothetical protein
MGVLCKITAACILVLSSHSLIQGQNWYKGNLHTHSYWSDGDDYPEMITDWYKSNGYQFLGLSEHNKIQEGPAWKSFKGASTKTVFDKYLSRFGSLVDYFDWGNDLNVVRLKTLEEYRGLFEEKEKFMLFQSEEITSNLYTHPIHMVATNIKYTIAAQYAKTSAGVISKTVTKMQEHRKDAGMRSMLHLCHPNFGYSLTANDIIPVKDLRLFEVFNGADATNTFGNAINSSTEEIWDAVNIDRAENSLPLLLGLGVDDSHNYHDRKPEDNITGRAWIVVNAPRLNQDEIVEAIEDGRFYASNGVSLEKLSFGNKAISVTVQQKEGVTYKIEFIGVKKGKKVSQVLKTIEGVKGEYELKTDDLFVRAKITSSKLVEGKKAGRDVESAWTQPVSKHTGNR